MSVLDRRRWLTRHHEGRLLYRTGCGPRALAITYVVAGDYVLIKIPEYNPVAGYASGQQVELAVPHGDGDLWVRGQARPPGPGHARLLEQAEFPEGWPEGVRTHVLCILLSDVTQSEAQGTAPADSGD